MGIVYYGCSHSPLILNTSGVLVADFILKVEEALDPNGESFGDLWMALVLALAGGAFSSFLVIPSRIGCLLLKGFRNGTILI